MPNEKQEPKIHLETLITEQLTTVPLRSITFAPITFPSVNSLPLDFSSLSNNVRFELLAQVAQPTIIEVLLRRHGFFRHTEVEQRIYPNFSTAHHYAHPPAQENSAQENNFAGILENFRRQLNANRITDCSERYAVDEDTPDRFICPLTLEFIRDPVFIVADNRYYDREALQGWYNSFNTASEYGLREPFCLINRDIALPNPQELPTDTALQAEIVQYKEQRHLAQQRQTSVC